MEHNHPPLNHDQRLSSPLPDLSYFRPHLRPADHMFPACGRAPQIGGPSYLWVNEYHRHPIGMQEAIWRQIEKERIREEIIAEEIERRRVLEAEVRRELMVERKLAMQRGDDGSFYSSHLKSLVVDPKGFPPLPAPQKMDGSTHGERIEMSTLVSHKFGSLETSSKRAAETSSMEFVTSSDTVKEKQKIIFLAKPEPKKSGMTRKAEVLPSVGAKRKAEEVFMPFGASELPPGGGSLKKKIKEEWSCALCQVSSTSERALNEHLQGKKHKAKEAVLRKNGKNFSIGLYPKTNPMPNKLPQISSIPCFEKGVYFAETKMPETADPAEAKSEKSEANTVGFRSRKLDRKLKKNEAQACRIRKIREQKNFKFWCEMCQIGAFSEKVMETHRKGKRHLALLLEQNTVSKPSTQFMQAKNEMNVKEEDAKVVEGSPYLESAPCIDEVKLDSCQKETREDGEDISYRGFCLVADEVELEGSQNEAAKVVGNKSESLDPLTDKVELEGEKKEACEDDADSKSEGLEPEIEVDLECDQKEESTTDADNSD